MDENEEFGEMRYSKFIKMADEVTTKMKQDCVLNAKCKFAYTKHHAFASHDEKRNKLDADVEENSSLMLAFMFYAAMQQTGSSSFTATQIANETLSFFEMDKFARDFGIVPKLMTKHELKIVWQDYIQIYAATTGGKPLQALNFEQFQDLFVRLALYMYNKPGMKKMILAVNGHFPSPEDIVECLCRHCNLQNFDAVKEHIMTEGRETQGAINFRAQEEENWRAKEELIIDLRAKHAERAAKKEEALKKKREQDKLKKQREELGIEEEEETKSGKKSVQYGLWSGSGGRSYDQGSDWKHLQARQAHKDKLRDKRSILPKSLLTMMKTLSEPELHADGSANTTTGGGVEGVGSNAGAGNDTTKVDTATATGTNGLNTSSTASAASGGGGTFPGIGETKKDNEEEDDEDELYTYDKATAVAKKRGTRLDLISDQYTHELVRVLDKYSHTDPIQETPGTIECGGAFVDAGHLPPHTTCKITLSVTNLLMDIIKLDCMAVGFEDENTSIVLSPNPLTSGMSRTVCVRFTIGGTLGSRLQNIVVEATNKRGMSYELNIPLYYRVDNSTSSGTLTTTKTLADMVKKYHGRNDDLRLTFNRQKEEASAIWTRPLSKTGIRRSVQELRPNSRSAINAQTAMGMKDGTQTQRNLKSVSGKNKERENISEGSPRKLKPLSASSNPKKPGTAN
jgi:hypothetical protein